MTFNSLPFLLFFAIVFLLYWITPARFRYVTLLIASYFFYLSWNPWCGFLILGTTLISYLSGLALGKVERKGYRKAIVITTVILCLSTVVVFKYLDFLIGTGIAFLNLFGLGLQDYALHLILPVGISFYTFQTLSYVIDCYRGTFVPEKHFGYYALFVSYFPQLVAGPIERPNNLIPQLREKHQINSKDLEIGLRFVIIGFIRKVVIADFIGIYVNSVYSNLADATSISILVASFLFLIQIYCDFAGYSEIARGVSKMMGIDLMQNFDSPFLAHSVTGFMRRWHLSLSLWFRDYVYIPLGGNRRGKARKYLNIFIVYALSGLWHGANWTFVLWGIHTCMWIIIEDLLKKPFLQLLDKLHIKQENPVLLWVRRMVTMVILSFGAFFFRGQSLSDIGIIFTTFFTSISKSFTEATATSLSMTFFSLIHLVFLFVLLVIIAFFYEKKLLFKVDSTLVNENQLFMNKTIVYTLAIALIVVSWFYLLLLSGGSSQFVYFQF